MAGVPLIEQYLTELRRYLGRIRRADEICAEARDHLLAAVERHHASGTDLDQAQRRALADYGDSRTVARSFLTARGKIMLPTHTTRLAGFGTIAAAMMWLSLASLSLSLPTAPWGDDPMVWLLRAVASGLTVWAVAGLIVRHGGANGALGLRGVLSLGLIAMCQLMGFTVWSLPGWVVVQGVGMLLVGGAMWSAGIAPRTAILPFAGGPLLAMLWFWVVVLTAGDVPVTAPFAATRGAFAATGGTPITVGMFLMALGLADLGHWMRRDVPVEDLEAASA